jgi:hypothetical protein
MCNPILTLAKIEASELAEKTNGLARSLDTEDDYSKTGTMVRIARDHLMSAASLLAAAAKQRE